MNSNTSSIAEEADSRALAVYFLASLKKLENIRIKLDIKIRIELNRGDSDPSWKREMDIEHTDITGIP